LDPFRNGPLQTVVSPYSVRRKPHAPISTPLAWSEVSAKLDPSRFNLGNFQSRLKKADPWADFFDYRQSLSYAMKSLKRI
jgi:bifunctional non-homologous end joining protein LigD